MHVGDHVIQDLLAELVATQGEREAWQGDEGVAPPTTEPRIAGDDEGLAVALHDELFGGVLQAVEERGTGCVALALGLVQLGDLGGVHRLGAQGDVKLLVGYLRRDAARHQQVLVPLITAVELFLIFHPLVPVRVVLVGDLLGTLDIDGRVAVVETEAHPVLDRMRLTVGRVVAMGQGMHVAERQHGLELEGR